MIFFSWSGDSALRVFFFLEGMLFPILMIFEQAYNNSLRHSDFKTATDRYVDAVNERKQTVIQQVDNLISQGRTGDNV